MKESMYQAQRKQRMLQFLEDIHSQCQTGLPFIMTEIVRRHRFQDCISVIMKDKKLISQQKRSVYKWVSPIEPNIHMASAVLKIHDEQTRNRVNRSRNTKVAAAKVEEAAPKGFRNWLRNLFS